MKKLLLINLLLCLGVFYSSAQTTITAAEYFFDTDPGVGNGVPVSLTAADTITTTLSFPTSALSNGRHLFCFRTKDDLGKWGLATVTPFLLEPQGNQLIKGEYFFDTDPGMGNATAFTFAAADTVNNSFSLPFSSISLGLHNFCLRMKDNANNWSAITCNLMQVVPVNDACTDAEYYFDTDPGVGNGNLLNLNLFTDTINLNSMAVPVPLAMPVGTHYLFIRSKNNGRVFSLAAIDTFDVTASPLPVNLLSFTAQKLNQQVLLNWRTAQETNNRGFEVQRSADGISFSAIGWVNGIGNSSLPYDYSLIDATPLKGKNLYRLKQIDTDGHFKLSAVRKVDFESILDFTIYPNPVTDVLNVQLSKNITGIKILDTQGKLVWQQQNADSLLSVSIPVQKLAGGIYVLEVSDREGNRQTQKFIKE